MDSEVSARWRQVGRSHGLTTDPQIARFLLDQYCQTGGGDVGKSSSTHCARCDAPLMLVCVNCHLKSLHGQEESAGILCMPADSNSGRQYEDGSRQSGAGVKADRQSPFFVLPDTEKERDEFLPEVKQEPDTECSFSVENRDTEGSFSVENRDTEGSFSVGNRDTDCKFSVVNRDTDCKFSVESRDTESRFSVENRNIMPTNMVVNPFGSTVSSIQFSGGDGGASVSRKNVSGPLDPTVSSTHFSGHNVATLAGKIVNPLLLTVPSTQLRGGHCEQKRVDDCSLATGTDSQTVSQSHQNVKVASTGRKSGQPRKILPKPERQQVFTLSWGSNVPVCGNQTVLGTAPSAPTAGMIVGSESGDMERPLNSAGSEILKDHATLLTVLSSQLGMKGSDTDILKSSADADLGNKSGKKRGRVPKPSEVHPCPQCDLVFPTAFRMRKHMKTHPGLEKPHKCPHCEKRYVRNAELILHIRSHTGERPFACTHCDKNYSKKECLINHMRCHTGEKPFLCEECGAGFMRKEYLTGHMRLHTGAQPFVCTHCDRRFARRENLLKHIRRHKGVKPHSCQYCGKSYTARSDLKIHEMLHTNEKPFSCTKCEAKFRTKTLLNNHMAKHSDVKPFRCAECGAAYRYSRGLRRHKSIHTGEKPFSCDQCDFKCASAENLTSHKCKNTVTD